MRGDDKRIQQAVVNVLFNAVQAVDDGGRVRVSVVRDRGRWRVVVEDDGRGIPKKHLREVTQPFFTDRAGGSGLGLAIVRSVVEEHGGSLAIDSEPGRGTRVELAFPAVDDGA